MQKGLFISIEGCEGSGKSTLLKLLSERLEENKVSYITTREPGGTEIGEKIRGLIMDYQVEAKTEALLFAAARVEHIERKIKPAVKKGDIVITDRYIHSSVVYQGTARGLGAEKIYDLNKWAVDNYMPNIIIYLDILPEDGLKRISENERDTNRFDHETIEFHQKIYDAYKSTFAKENNVVVIDARLTAEEIVDIAYNKIMELYV